MNDPVRTANRRLLRRLCFVVVAMFGFGFALVPLYEKFCEVTGIRTVARAEMPANTQIDASRSVRVEFDTNVRNLPWRFRPREPVVSVHPGEVVHAVFDVVNTTDRPITGRAIPSYGPQYAGRYFRKLDCFCFARQTLQPGETRAMPVVFVIDPAAPREIATISLSYTFFEVEDNRS
jgi:cytochrome c oxidase assembly protein subunit 11